MSRQDEMRELVKRLAGNNANRLQCLDSLRCNVQQQRSDAALAVREMAANRVEMSTELHAGLAGGLTDLRDAVQVMLDDLGADRQEMKADLQADLVATRQARQHHVTSLRTNARQFVEKAAETRQAIATDLSAWLSDNRVELHAGVQELLGSFADERASMSENMHRALTAETEARRQDVANMVAAIEAMLDRFAAENQATATELHESLDANAAERKQTLASLLANIRVLLQQLAAENHAAAAELRAFLAADRIACDDAVTAFRADNIAQRHAMTRELAARLEHYVTSLTDEVSARLASFGTERRDLQASLTEMSAIWRAFASRRREHQGEAEPVGGAELEPAAVTEASPAIKIEAEHATTLAETEIATRILSFLANRPEGAKLVDLEPELGLSRPQLGRYLRSLVDSGKIMKDTETLVYRIA